MVDVGLGLELKPDAEIANGVEEFEVDGRLEDVEVATNPDFNDEATNVSENEVVLANTLIGESSSDAKISTGAVWEVLLQVYEVCVPRLGLD